MESWKFYQLDELTESDSPITYGVIKPGPEGNVLFIRGGDLEFGRVRSEQLRTITREISDNYKRTILRGGELLISLVGTPGQVAIAPDSLAGANIARQVGLIRLVPKINKLYVCYYLQSPQGLESLGAETSGAVQLVINLGALRTVRIPAPCLKEQKRIVAILDQVFADIEQARAKTEQNLKNARELFESYLQQVFCQRGEGWIDKRLGNICTFSSGGTPSKKNSSYWTGDIPWVSGRDMKSTQLFDSVLHISQSAVNESSTRVAPAGSLLALVRGMGLAHGAQVAELTAPCAFNQDIRAIHPEPDLVPRYLVFALRDRINSSDNILSSAAHGTLKINMDELKNVVIPVPSTSRQRNIVDRLDDFIEEADHLESIYMRKLKALDELKKSILQKAFTDELAKENKGAAE